MFLAILNYVSTTDTHSDDRFLRSQQLYIFTVCLHSALLSPTYTLAVKSIATLTLSLASKAFSNLGVYYFVKPGTSSFCDWIFSQVMMIWVILLILHEGQLKWSVDRQLVFMTWQEWLCLPRLLCCDSLTGSYWWGKVSRGDSLMILS